MWLSLNTRTALLAAVVCTGLGAASPASAVAINTTFNFVPTGTLTANTGDVTTATSITSGSPLLVTGIVTDNTGLISGVTVITLSNPVPTVVGGTFTKTYSTALGTFVENLTVISTTPGPSSLGVTATGTITETVCVGTCLTPSSVVYTAAYTQNTLTPFQINASYNDSTTAAVPGPIVGAGLPGMLLACGALMAFARRRRQMSV